MKKINTILRGMTFLMCLFSVTVFAQSYPGTGGLLPDSSCNSSHEFPLFVSGVTAGNNLTQVSVNISHTWNSDLDITLIAPNGASIDLSSDNGGSSDGYDCSFRDDAASSIVGQSGFPITGIYQPEQALSTFAGQGNGVWTLRVCDDAGGDTGALNSWMLLFENIAPPPPSYCPGIGTSGDGSGMTSVAVGSSTFPISMPNAGDFYQDVTGSPATLQQGIDGTLEVLYGHSFTYWTFAWIDFNDDYVFDSSELVSSGNSSGGSGNSISTSITVPAGADLGVHRMRVLGSDFGSSPDPCREGTWQATVDLDVEIIEPLCQQATIGATSVQEDCNPSNPVYFVNVDIQAGADAVSIEANGTGVNANFPIVNTGNNQVGPFPSGVEVTLTVVHSDTECNIDLGEFVFNCPPPNDACANAIAVDCGSVETGSTQFANSESVPFCGTTLSTANGVWYSMVGTGGDIIVDLSGSLYDTKLGVFTGSCGSLVCVGGDDDGGTGVDSRLQFSSDAGTTYYIYVTGFGSSRGTYTMSIDCVCDVYIEEGPCVKLYTGYGPTSSIQLNAVGQFGLAPYTYEWSDGQTGASVTVSPTSQTDYIVTVTDSAGCVSTASTSVLVQDISCQDNGNDNNAKVNICHDGEPLCVSTNAVQAHLNHGDSLGACDDDVNCSTAPVCDARLKVPAPMATDVSANIEISWGAATGYVQGYFLSVGTTAGGTDILNGVDVGYVLDYDLSGLLDYSTTYYVTIVPYNNIGVGTACESSYFTTESGPWCDGSAVACDSSVSGNTGTDGEITQGLSFCGTTLTTAPGVWHTFVGTGDEVVAGLCNSSYDTKIGVFTGDCSAISCVVGTDDGGSCSGFLQSEVEFQTVAGETYYIYVTGFSSSTGNYTLDITCLGAPEPNPACEAAISIECNSVTAGSTVGFSTNDLDFCGTSLTSAPGRFYKFEPSVNGPIEVTTCSAGTSYDTKLGVFTTSDCVAFTCVGGDDDDSCPFSNLRSRVNFNAVVGNTYYIYVTGFGSGQGNFELVLNCANERAEAETSTFETTEWTLYPNPATNGEVELNLSNYLNQDVSIQMMDFSGKVMVDKNEPNLQTPRYRLSTSGMSYGMYFVRVATESGVSTKKLIIANN